MKKKAALSLAGYAPQLVELKERERAAQMRAAATNTELRRLYWQIGRAIVTAQAKAGWLAGRKVLQPVVAGWPWAHHGALREREFERELGEG